MLADNIKRLRGAAGLTQKELAEAAGFSQSYISELETGDKPNPPMETVKSIAVALKSSVSTLLGEGQNA